MKIIFFLGTCSTCKRILSDWKPGKDVQLQDIKEHPITPVQLDAMARLSGTYESLFSRRALKFRSMGFDRQSLGEKDYRKLILEEYTFLKRPVYMNGKEIFVGSANAVVDAAKKSLRS